MDEFQKINTDETTSVKVSGTVTDESGNPIDQSSLEITDQADGSTVWTGSSNSTGDWSTDLGDGDYEVTASKSGYNPNSTTFTVAGSAVSGLDLTLTQPTVSGQVVTNDGGTCADCTVEIWMLNDANTTTDAGETIEDAQEDTVETLSRSVPRDLYDPDVDPINADKFTGENAGKQVLVHNPSAWYEEGDAIGPYQPGYAGTEDLERPVRQLEPGVEYSFSIWDRTSDPFAEDGVDSKVEPGVSDSGTVVIEQVGPGNSTIDRIERNTTEKIETGVGFTVKKHEYVRLALPEGYYKLAPKSGGVPQYVRVGSPETIPRTIDKDVQDVEGNAASIAQEAQQKIDDGAMERVTVQADADGRFSYNVPTGYSTVSISVFDGRGLLEGINDPTLGDLRTEIQRQDYNGSIYLSTKPTVVNPPNEDVSITVTEVQNPTLQDVSTYLGQLAWVKNMTNQEAFIDVAHLFTDAPADVSKYDLEERGQRLQDLIEQNQKLQEQVEKAINQDSSVTKEYTTIKKEIHNGGLSEGEVQALLDAQREAILANQTDIDVSVPNDPDLTPQDGGPTLMDATILVDGPSGSDTTLTEEGVELIAHYDNGTSATISEEYWTVENGVGSSQGASSEIVLEEYPVPADVAVASIEVVTANDAGVGHLEFSVENPAVEGTPPRLASIDVNTMRPGPSDRVSISVTPTETSTYQSLQGATVYGPDGSALNTSVAGDEVEFTTNGAGSHLVKLEVSDGSRTYVETVRIKAGEEDTKYPASVRVHSGVLGKSAIASDGVEHARLSIEEGGSVARVTAAVDAQDVPTRIDVHARDLTGIQREISVSVVKSSDESRINKGVQVKIHTARISEDAHVRVNGNPVTEDGSKWGTVEHYSDSTLITTNLRDGSIETSINNNPGWVAQAGWWLDTTRSKYSVLATAPVQADVVLDPLTDALGGIGSLVTPSTVAGETEVRA